MSVYVCLSVCPRTYLENCTSSLHQIVARLTVARWRYDTLRMDDVMSARDGPYRGLDAVAASDVIASSCAVNAPAAPCWLRRVADDGMQRRD